MKFIKNTIFLLIFLTLGLTSCKDTAIYGNDLSNQDLKNILKQVKLKNDEKIEMFYCTLSSKTTGNYITKYRIGSYLQYENNGKKLNDYAFFNEIDSLYSDFSGDFGYGNRIYIIKKDRSRFFVNVNGEEDLINEFYNRAKKYWSVAKKK